MKKFFALLLALTMVLSLVACGGSNDAAESTDDAATEETAEGVTVEVIAAQYGTQTADWWLFAFAHQAKASPFAPLRFDFVESAHY